MSNTKLIILEMIKDNIPLSEIEKQLNLSVSELSKELKEIREYGYNFNNHIYSDGGIILKPNRTLNINTNNSLRINIKGKELRSLFISDQHIGSISDNPYYIKLLYNYAKEHDIHIIFNCGDEIDNVYPDSDQKLKNKTVISQINKFVRIFPHDPDIIYINLYGNHDYKSILDEGFDMSRVISNKRYDMISLGYGYGTIILKDDQIALSHDINKNKQQEKPVSLTYKGHSHKAKYSDKDERVFYVPSLSDLTTKAYDISPLPGFLEAEYLFFDKYIERVNQRQLAIVNKELRLANEESLILRLQPPKINSNESNQ